MQFTEMWTAIDRATPRFRQTVKIQGSSPRIRRMFCHGVQKW